MWSSVEIWIHNFIALVYLATIAPVETLYLWRNPRCSFYLFLFSFEKCFAMLIQMQLLFDLHERKFQSHTEPGGQKLYHFKVFFITVISKCVKDENDFSLVSFAWKIAGSLNISLSGEYLLKQPAFRRLFQYACFKTGWIKSITNTMHCFWLPVLGDFVVKTDFIADFVPLMNGIKIKQIAAKRIFEEWIWYLRKA